MTNFLMIFGSILALNVVVTFRSSDYWKTLCSSSSSSSSLTSGVGSLDASDQATAKREWQSLLRKYLPVYLLATLSDWLQGPYVYALYSEYGFAQHDIAVLFVAGFGSSMVFGSFIGGMADWGGRRNFAVLFAIIYAGSCITKHFNDFKVLMLGRLLGGIATSLLFSVFDAWLIRAHADAQLKSFLGKSFSWAAYGNSIIAIVAGLLANKAASTYPMVPIQEKFIYVGGFLNPFDIAIFALIGCAAFALSTWEENYGDSDQGPSSAENAKNEAPRWYDGLRSAFVTTIRNQDIFLCGIISSLFEGSMYIFVFFWTPSLRAGAEDELPFGLIFSTFMVSCMAGSSMFSIQVEYIRIELLAIYAFAIGSVAMGIIALSPSNTIKFIAMNLFEITVGMYFPIMGTMKGSIVPESKRAAIYNLYRIPLNFIVLMSLLTDLSPFQAFSLNSIMLGIATLLQFVLMKRRQKTTSGGTGNGSGESLSGDEMNSLMVGDQEDKADV